MTGKRRYAIGFLGVARITDAPPVLRTILNNESQKDYFRADALESVYRIAKEEGLGLAARHRSRGDFLGYVARGLIDLDGSGIDGVGNNDRARRGAGRGGGPFPQ